MYRSIHGPTGRSHAPGRTCVSFLMECGSPFKGSLKAARSWQPGAPAAAHRHELRLARSHSLLLPVQAGEATCATKGTSTPHVVNGSSSRHACRATLWPLAASPSGRTEHACASSRRMPAQDRGARRLAALCPGGQKVTRGWRRCSSPGTCFPSPCRTAPRTGGGERWRGGVARRFSGTWRWSWLTSTPAGSR